MKKILNIVFVILGVIFFFVLIALAYLFVTDPFNIRPLLFSEDKADLTTTSISATSSTDLLDKSKEESVDKNLNLSPAQEKVLSVVGIDPADVPSSFTSEQISCFETILGSARVAEIKAGDNPTVGELFSAKSCI
jgi:hypothetical protein